MFASGLSPDETHEDENEEQLAIRQVDGGIRMLWATKIPC